MILFVGGLIGAGKSSVAKALAEHFSYYYFELDELKRTVYAKYPEAQKCLSEGTPVDLGIRQEVFLKAAEELKQLSKTHQNIVMDEVFHIRKFRHMVFRAAEEINQPFIFILVHAEESVIIDRLTEGKREQHLLEDPIPMHTAMHKEFDEFDRSIVYCANNGTIENSVSNLLDLLNQAAALQRSQSQNDS